MTRCESAYLHFFSRYDDGFFLKFCVCFFVAELQRYVVMLFSTLSIASKLPVDITSPMVKLAMQNEPSRLLVHTAIMTTRLQLGQMSSFPLTFKR